MAYLTANISNYNQHHLNVKQHLHRKSKGRLIMAHFYSLLCSILEIKKEKSHRKQLLNSWKLSSSIWRTVNVDGGLDLFCIVQELFFWLSKQICHPVRKVLESNVKPCKGNNNQDTPSYENLRKHEFMPGLQLSSSCYHFTDEETCIYKHMGFPSGYQDPSPHYCI